MELVAELDFGDWEMMPWNAIPRDAMEAWSKDYLNVRCPQGESLQDMMDRVLPYWKSLVQGLSTNVILISHAGPIRTILSLLLGLDPRDLFTLPIDFGSLTKIQCQGEIVEVEFMNQ